MRKLGIPNVRIFIVRIYVGHLTSPAKQGHALGISDRRRNFGLVGLEVAIKTLDSDGDSELTRWRLIIAAQSGCKGSKDVGR